RDRWRVRRREGDRRRPGIRLGRLEGLHAPQHQHGELLHRAAAGPGRRVHLVPLERIVRPETVIFFKFLTVSGRTMPSGWKLRPTGSRPALPYPTRVQVEFASWF